MDLRSICKLEIMNFKIFIISSLQMEPADMVIDVTTDEDREYRLNTDFTVEELERLRQQLDQELSAYMAFR